MDYFSVITAVLAALLALTYWLKQSRPKNYPPGPPGLPFVGHTFSVGSPRRPAATFMKWKAQYGDIFSVKLGGRRMVVLSDIATARRIFQDDNVTGRDQKSLIRTEGSYVPPGAGIIVSNHELWKTHRRFALSTLRDLGMGKNWLEDTILTEVEELCQILRDTKQTPFNPKVKLTNSVSNVICALIFGRRFELNDPKFSRLTGLIAENVSGASVEGLAKTLPFLMWFPNRIRNLIYRARLNRDSLVEFMQEMIAEEANKKDHDSGDVQDYLRAYQREKETGAKTADKETFDDKQLVASLLDLFGAGTETTSTTVLWAFLLMIVNPDIQRKIQEEIDTTVGRDKVLTNSDRARLPYTDAAILEVQRIGSLVPLGGRVNFEETTIDGYTIPKGTSIMINLYGVNRDPRYWKNPEQFDPTRFLDENNKIIKPEGFVPFSVGKRSCPGEALAKMELFLFTANLLRCFTVKLPPGKTLTTEDYVMGVVSAPIPFDVVFIPRTSA
ncbi:Cytochrome P450 2J5 [Hypsibius exemplaris]|uniref:Cytochrome P450 2J5 n=1 Tax=Hypsibius exemplaris TaxID=2072580 RepID=A0A1W0WCA4_HYPEX|nr:Cytochrome P450 2J5 [Hypsibius exemplaris]